MQVDATMTIRQKKAQYKRMFRRNVNSAIYDIKYFKTHVMGHVFYWINYTAVVRIHYKNDLCPELKKMFKQKFLTLVLK